MTHRPASKMFVITMLLMKVSCAPVKSFMGEDSNCTLPLLDANSNCRATPSCCVANSTCFTRDKMWAACLPTADSCPYKNWKPPSDRHRWTCDDLTNGKKAPLQIAEVVPWVQWTVLFEVFLMAAAVYYFYRKDKNMVVYTEDCTISACGSRWDMSQGDFSDLLLLSQQEGPSMEEEYEPVVSREMVVLSVWRSVVFVWMLFAQIHEPLVYGWDQYVGSLGFFTIWNYHLQIVFFFLAALSSWTAVLGASPATCISKACLLLFQVCLPMSIFVCLSIWFILEPVAIAGGDLSGLYTFWGNYNVHLLNTVCFLIEFYSNRVLVSRKYFPISFVWTSVYCVSIWIWIAAEPGHQWPYFFLILTPPALVWYPALVFGIMMVYWACITMSRCKERQLA